MQKILVRVKEHLYSVNMRNLDNETKRNGVIDSLYESTWCTDLGYVKRECAINFIFHKNIFAELLSGIYTMWNFFESSQPILI